MKQNNDSLQSKIIKVLFILVRPKLLQFSSTAPLNTLFYNCCDLRYDNILVKTDLLEYLFVLFRIASINIKGGLYCYPVVECYMVHIVYYPSQ